MSLEVETNIYKKIVTNYLNYNSISKSSLIRMINNQHEDWYRAAIVMSHLVYYDLYGAGVCEILGQYFHINLSGKIYPFATLDTDESILSRGSGRIRIGLLNQDGYQLQKIWGELNSYQDVWWAFDRQTLDNMRIKYL
jgi:hypothetical protein